MSVPLIYTFPTPSGVIEDETFRSYLDEMLNMLVEQGPWDGILLAQHGAAVAETEPDADGAIIESVRNLLGQEMPIAVALDLHANVSERMITNSTITVAYRTNPHVDARSRAFDAAVLAIRTARGEIHPVQAFERLPLVPEIARQNTEDYPMRDLYAGVALAARDILSASMTMGYPYADVAELGMTCIAIADRDIGKAQDAAGKLARAAWAQRTAMTGGVVAVADAMLRLRSAAGGPALLLDTGDNIGGGAPGDSTFLLNELRKAAVGHALAIINDPVAASLCHNIGAGGHLTTEVGGSSNPGSGPFSVSGRITSLHDGPFQGSGPTHAGIPHFDMGRTAVLESYDGFTIVLTSTAIMPITLAQLDAVQIDPRAYRVIVAKGVQSPLPAYGPIATEIFRVDTPGATAPTLANLSYKHRPRPLYPLDHVENK